MTVHLSAPSAGVVGFAPKTTMREKKLPLPHKLVVGAVAGIVGTSCIFPLGMCVTTGDASHGLERPQGRVCPAMLGILVPSLSLGRFVGIDTAGIVLREAFHSPSIPLCDATSSRPHQPNRHGEDASASQRWFTEPCRSCQSRVFIWWYRRFLQG